MKKMILFAFGLMTFFFTNAQLKLANIFNDHMVLQRNAPINIWGNAMPNEKLVVQFHNQIKKVTADKTGKWLTTLNNEEAGGAYVLSVIGKKNKIVVNDILVGDVWLCSGQSNMEWVLKATINADNEIAVANNNLIRHVKIEHAVSIVPKEEILPSVWKVCTPENAGDFTAVGYYFAKSLNKELNVPIGLINSSWGGTIVETWISKTGLQSNAEFLNVANQLPSSLEQFEKEQLQRIKNDVQAFQQTKENEVAKNWEAFDYDDSFWSSLLVAKGWEEQGLPTFDGTVWYRTSFELNENQLNNDIVLYLGTIDDNDITYVNGVKVGETSGWDIKRKYVVSKSLLRKGKNIIAVKVLDTGGGGGFYGEAENMKVQIGDAMISLAKKWKARIDVTSSLTAVNPNSMPTLLYNTMIHPLLNVGIKGAIWYQGESNADRAFQYNQSFPLMIKDWREKFKQPSLPFYFVQLATFNANNQNDVKGSNWAELRDAQFKTTSLHHTGMAVTIDIGDAKNLHPFNKKDVGNRLALLALKNDYGKKIIASGPTYKAMIVEKNKIKIQFDNIGSGLVALNNKYGYLQGFMIAGKDQQFKWAKAMIVGNEIVVWNDDIAEPVAVRYAWMDDATEANLFNNEGLPASPFRSDNWKILTQDKKYVIGE